MPANPLSDFKKIKTIRTGRGEAIEIYSSSDWRIVEGARKPSILDFIACHIELSVMALILAAFFVAFYFGS